MTLIEQARIEAEIKAMKDALNDLWIGYEASRARLNRKIYVQEVTLASIARPYRFDVKLTKETIETYSVIADTSEGAIKLAEASVFDPEPDKLRAACKRVVNWLENDRNEANALMTREEYAHLLRTALADVEPQAFHPDGTPVSQQAMPVRLVKVGEPKVVHQLVMRGESTRNEET